MEGQSSSLHAGIYQFILKQPCIIYRTTAVESFVSVTNVPYKAYVVKD